MLSNASCVVHVEAALRLTDQPEIRVVHDDVHIRQLELRTGREFFDHELEVVVARQRDDLALRIGRPHAEHGRNGPAVRAGLTAVDPVARLVHMHELAALGTDFDAARMAIRPAIADAEHEESDASMVALP